MTPINKVLLVLLSLFLTLDCHFIRQTGARSLAFRLLTAEASLGPTADPTIEWKKIETPHFEIVFDSRHYFLAREFAQSAERAWQTLVPVLRTWPDKTVIVIDDSGDMANGLALGFPYPQIRLFPAAPNPGETIAETGPWTLELITHEYTHVLNFQPAHGVMHWMRNIFGSIVRPNLLLPRWYSEGLAVEMETRFSPSGGRLRSADFTAIPRAMVLDDVLRKEDISRINEVSIPDWPGGARPYLFGGLIWHRLARGSLNMVGDLNDHFARRVPFFIETPVEERFEKNWSAILAETYSEVEARAVNQIERICDPGCEEGASLEDNSFFSRSPVVDTTGDHLAWLSREHNHDSVVLVAPRKPDGSFDINATSRLAEPTAANRVAWLPEPHSAVLFDGLDSVGRYEERSELWIYDIAAKKKHRLSMGLRGREADVSRFSDRSSPVRVAFTQLTPGRTQIATATIAPNEKGAWKISGVEVAYTPEGENRVSWPTFTGENELVFVERSADGKEGLRALDLQTKRTRRLDLGGNATFPRWIESKPQGLLFASHRSGVTNLYFAKATREGLGGGFAKPVALTNTATRAWSGELDPKTRALIYSRLDGSGSRLRVIAKPEERAALPVIEPLIERREAPFTPPATTLSETELEAKDFSSWNYLIPRYWMPFLSYVPGGAFFSASTSSGDPLGRHALAAGFSSDSRIGKPNMFLAYSNNTTPVKLTLLGDDTWQRLSTGLNRRTTTGDLSGVFYLPGLSNSWFGEAGFNYQRSELQTTTSVDERQRGGPRLGLLWSDLSQKGREISPEEGGLAKLSHAWYRPEFGNQVYDKTDISLTGYFSRVSHSGLRFLPERHVLVLSAAASWAPSLDRLFLGPSSISLNVENIALGASSTSFVMRGYPSGSFIGRKLIRSSVEYRMPLSESYHGFDTVPAFVQRWHGAVFADAVAVDGAFYDFDFNGYRAATLDSVYAAVGAEARLDMTILYHVPLQLIFGVHYGFDKRINPNGAYPILSIAL